MAASATRRVVALGASNLTRGFQTLVATARAQWGQDVDVIAALGHGRSFGSESRFIARTIPGILQSDLWRQLDRLPPLPTRAIVSDIGNDILYGFSDTQILTWVEEAVDRLARFSDDIVLAGLPRVGVNDISSAKFLFFRSFFFPRCRLSFAEVAEIAERVRAGVSALAEARKLRFVRLKDEWYGIDPIHFRPSKWRDAWQEIVCGDSGPALGSLSRMEALQLYLMRPRHQRVFGLEFGAEQHGVKLPAGGRIWLY
jgi:hypothetical protein